MRAATFIIVVSLGLPTLLACASGGSEPTLADDAAEEEDTAVTDDTAIDDSVSDAAADACTPKTCVALGFDCGKTSNGCGGTINCGDCGRPQTCGGGGPNRCGGCTPFTCTELSKNCGSVPDGCGTIINCGACTGFNSCGGGGTLNLCGCTPTTCAAAGKNCGTMPDGCGKTLNCGACSLAGETCGGTGVANVCGVKPCVPITACPSGKNCGPISDGCSSTLDCGSCTAPQTCGGSGVLNACGCTKATCTSLSASCGTPSDGCGGTLASCGACALPQTCGGGGTPLACGCTKTSCSALAAECGTPSDGCGGTLPSCGSCASGSVCDGSFKCACVKASCAAAGKVCGTMPDGCGGTLTCTGCPGGFTCGAGDKCIVSEASTTAVCSPKGWCFASPLPQPYSLQRAFARSATDVWAVGASGTIIHFDGSQWRGLAGVTNKTFNDVWASSATDVWAIADGLLLHGNGAGTWTYVPVPVAHASDRLLSLWGTSPSDVVIVGGDVNPVLLRWDGTALIEDTVPAAAGGLRGVWKDATAGMWVVGTGGIYHHDGTSWTKEDSATTMLSVWGSAGSVFAAGGNYAIKRRVGTSWLTMSTPHAGTSPYLDIFGVGDTEVYAVSANFVDRWNGTAWTNLYNSSALQGAGGTAAPALDLMVVGGDGMILTRTGTSTTSVNFGVTTSSYTQIASYAADDVWFGGSVNLRHWNGSAMDGAISAGAVSDVWASGAASSLFVNGPVSASVGVSSFTTDRTGSFIAVWGSSSADVWAVGVSGKTERRVAGTWAAVANPLTGTTVALRSVWGSSANDVWAVGDLGYILHWNGTAWSVSTTLAGGPAIYTVWGTSATDAWALTATTLHHWDGTSWTLVTTSGYSDISGTASEQWLVSAAGIVRRTGTTSTGFDPGLPGVTLRAIHRETGGAKMWAAGDKSVLIYGPP